MARRSGPTDAGGSQGEPDTGPDVGGAVDVPDAPPPAQPPPPTYGGGGGGYYGGGGGSKPPAAAPSGAWAGVNQNERNQVEDLFNQWELFSGYEIDVPDDQLAAMAKQNISTLMEFGLYVWNQTGLLNTDQKSKMPWVGLGMSRDQWNTTTGSFAANYKQATGEDFNLTAADPSAAGFADFNFLFTALAKGESSSDMMKSLQSNPDFLKKYGWVQYGLNYQDFQLQKTQMEGKFGATLTNDQAVTNLLYWHTFQGSDQTAHAQKQSAQSGQGVKDLVAETVVR